MQEFNTLATVDISHHVFVDSLLQCSNRRMSLSVSIRLYAISNKKYEQSSRDARKPIAFPVQ